MYVRSGQNDPDLETAEISAGDEIDDLESERLSDIQRFELKVNSKLSLSAIYYVLHTMVTLRPGDPVLKKADCLLVSSVVDGGLVDDDRTPEKPGKKRKVSLEASSNTESIVDHTSVLSETRMAFDRDYEQYRRSSTEKHDARE